jgi:CPA2 family monovalent cation:H+ antiporter-2
MLASHALALVGVSMRRVIRMVQEQRDERYKLLRGYFRGADDDTANEINEERLFTLTIPLNVEVLSCALGEMELEILGVQVVNLRRSNGQIVPVTNESRLECGDTLVLSGKPEALAMAEEKLLSKASRTAAG